MLTPAETRILSDKYRGLEYLNIPVALADMSFNLLYFNSPFSKLIQSSLEVFPVKDFHGLFHQFSEKIEPLKNAGLTSGHLLNFVLPNLKLKSAERYFDLQFSRIDPEIEHLDAFSISCIEVTEREKELQLHKELSEQHIKFLEYTTSGVAIHKDGTILFANKQLEKLLAAQTNESIVGKNIMTFVSEAYKEIVAERIKNITNKNEFAPVIEQKVSRLDGTVADVEIFSFPIQYRGTSAIKTIINDISERKKTENNLRDSEKKYVTLIENLRDVIFQTDTEANITYVNKAWLTLTGFSIEQTIGKSCFDFLHYPPGNTESFYQKIRKLISSGIDIHEHEMLIKTKASGWRHVQLKIQSLYDSNNRIKGIGGSISDIHARKLAQLELKNIEENLKQQQEILMQLAKSDAINEGDFDSAIQQIAKTASETLQVSRVNIWQFSENKSKLSCVANYDNEKKQFQGCISFTVDEFPKYFKHVLKQRIIHVEDALKDERIAEFKNIYILPAGISSKIDVSIIVQDDTWGVICFDHKGNKRHWTLEEQTFARSVSDFISLAYESSERKKIQLALTESEGLYRNLIEQASDAIFIIDTDDTFIDVNKKACELSGYTREEFIGMQVEKIFPERFIKKGVKVTDPIRTQEYFFKERIFKRKNGEERCAEISSVLLPDGKIQGIARDITERKKNEHALIDSEARLDLALKGADLGTWDFLIKEDKLVHNRRWGEMLGYNFEITVVNEQFWEKFVHPDDIAPAYEAFNKHIKGETPFYEATIRMLASNGEWRWILDKGKIVEWDENGNPIRASGIHQDITPLKLYEKEIQQQKIFFQQLVNALPNPVYVKNLNDEFIIVNDALSNLLGIDKKLLMQYQFAKKHNINKNIEKLIEKDFEVFISKKPVNLPEQKIQNEKTGEVIWLQSIKVPLYDADGNFNEILSVSTDITEIKNKEQQLANLNDNLEQKVNERTSLLESVNKELETFNYSVSHDLRTPLRTIDIFAYFLEKNYKQILDKEGTENIRQIRQSILKMTSLIDNLLVFSKMGKADVHFENIKTQELIHDVIEEIKEVENVNKIEFIISNMPTVYADYTMIKKVFSNLISNSIKFSRTRKNPVIEFFGHTEGDNTIIAIKDNGVGFSMEYKDKLFKAFKRLHSEEHFEGTGVGLAIVEKIIKRHGGQIWAESEENRGTTFFIKLFNK